MWLLRLSTATPAGRFGSVAIVCCARLSKLTYWVANNA